MLKIKVKRMSNDAVVPKRAHAHDAGLDLAASSEVSYTSDDMLIVVPTGISMEVEPGYVGLIADRSSMARAGFRTAGGVVDAGYTGEISVMLINVFRQSGKIAKGQRVAQIMIMPVSLCAPVEVDSLSTSERGDRGFGSSGK